MSEHRLTPTDFCILDGLAREFSLNAAARPGAAEVGEAIRKAVALLREQERVTPAEERAVWRELFAVAFGDQEYPTLDAARAAADQGLAVFLDRFGSPR